MSVLLSSSQVDWRLLFLLRSQSYYSSSPCPSVPPLLLRFVASFCVNNIFFFLVNRKLFGIRSQSYASLVAQHSYLYNNKRTLWPEGVILLYHQVVATTTNAKYATPNLYFKQSAPKEYCCRISHPHYLHYC